MEYNGVKIVAVGGLAERIGIKEGDVLYSINGRVICDIFDYRFAVANKYLNIQLADGRRFQATNKSEADIGLDFIGALFDGVKTCHNNCVFCFMAQNPKNMRKSLYLKDDDYRLSLLHGNYCTLTNLTDKDVEKIISLRISPINISVHTTNPVLRKQMLRSKNAGDSLRYLEIFAQNRIYMNAQIVLCPQINDGEHLDQTVKELSANPFVQSISIVPVGLTKYRDGLPMLAPVSGQCALRVLEQTQRLQRENLANFGSRKVFAADEFYVLCRQPIPTFDEYEDFPQLENGVGMMANMLEEFKNALMESGPPQVKHRVTILTGRAANEFMRTLANMVEQRYAGIGVRVLSVENKYFGERVTVAGLLTGRDIIDVIKREKVEGTVLIPKCALKSDQDIFLDEITLSQAQAETGASIVPCENDGYALWKSIINRL